MPSRSNSSIRDIKTPASSEPTAKNPSAGSLFHRLKPSTDISTTPNGNEFIAVRICSSDNSISLILASACSKAATSLRLNQASTKNLFRQRHKNYQCQRQCLALIVSHIYKGDTHSPLYGLESTFGSFTSARPAVAINRSTVALPDPNGPSTDKNSPALTAKSTGCSATTSPNFLETPLRVTEIPVFVLVTPAILTRPRFAP